jgi:hypothetical protein
VLLQQELLVVAFLEVEESLINFGVLIVVIHYPDQLGYDTWEREIHFSYSYILVMPSFFYLVKKNEATTLHMYIRKILQVLDKKIKMKDHNTILPMDPKQQVNQLDPKLKEAYERVMGTPVGGTSPQPASPAPAIPNQPIAAMPAATPMPPNPPTISAGMPNLTAPQGAPQPAMPIPQANAHIQQNPVTNPFGMPAQQPSPAVPAATSAPVPNKQGPGSHGFVANKKGLHISPLILILGGIVFLLVYTVFWFKFFNIPLPFIGQ